MENRMSREKFTKGEWSILPIEEDKEYIRIRGTSLGGRYKIANVIDLKEHHNGMNWCARERAESMANANLIKASPKMYKMLNSIFAIERERGGSLGVDGSFYYKISEDVFKQIAELLAEARGES